MASMGLIGCGADSNPLFEESDENSTSTRVARLIEAPTKIGFSAVRDLVFADNCLECHNSEKKVAGIDLANFRGLQETKIPAFLVNTQL